MLAFAYYILKVIICSAVLFGYYWLFLRNKIYHVYNRFYLLAVVVLALTLPLLKFNIWQHADAPKTKAIQILQLVSSSDDYVEHIVTESRSSRFNISNEQIAWWLFIMVCLVLTALLTRSLFKIYILKKNNPCRQYEQISVINTNDKSTPFSFLKNIFWNNAIDINSTNGNRILKHEIAHVKQKHSQDKLFINMVLIVFWGNPIFWLLRKELNLVHEFLADKKAVEDGDTAAFAAMILQTTYPAHQFEITNNFFYSPIKRRLAMLTKNNKTQVNYISRLLVLPLAVLVFAAFTLKTKTVQPVLPKGKTYTVVIDAGHGGSDGGAGASDGSLEKDIALELVKKISALNDNERIKIILTRETDVYLGPKQKANFATQQSADLFISVHCDYQPNDKAEKFSGLTVWTSPDQINNGNGSVLLASSVLESFKDNYSLPVMDVPMQRNAGVWVLKQSRCPAVLIEAGFINNKTDRAYMKSDAGQNQFAKNVLAAIGNFIENKNTAKNADTVIDTVPAKYKYNIGDGDSMVVVDTHKKVDQEQGIALKNKNVLYVVDGKVTDVSVVKNIDPATIKNVNVIKADAAQRKYGQKAKDGVVEIFLKKEAVSISSSPAETDITAAIPANNKGGTDIVFTAVEIKAEFPGGQNALKTYLSQNIDAAIPIQENWKEGVYTVNMKFIVSKDGAISNISTADFPGSKTAQMCIAVLKKSPNWKPAIQNGHAVASYRTQPISFAVTAAK